MKLLMLVPTMTKNQLITPTASVAANKISGIAAGLCHDIYSAHQGVEHDGGDRAFVLR